jgi:hypothetical protein
MADRPDGRLHKLASHIRLWLKRESWDVTGSVLGYLSTAARNRAPVQVGSMVPLTVRRLTVH